MMRRFERFNFYFLLVALGLLAGCASSHGSRKHPLATFRLYQAVRPDPWSATQVIQVGRDHPARFTVTKTPALTEINVKSAKVIDSVGGFALRIEFDRQGSWLFEQLTADTRGRHIAVLSQFCDPGDNKLNKGRWLAAPKITHNISDGLFVFTPDATKEEAEQIALGLNDVAKKVQRGEDVKFGGEAPTGDQVTGPSR